MEEQKENQKGSLLFLIFIIVGFIFASIGAGFALYTQHLKKVCSESVRATVVENVRIAGTTNRGHTKRGATYAPVFAYTYNGENYIRQSNSSSYPPKFFEGEEVEILLNPENPEQYYAPEDDTIKILYIVFISLGSLFMIFPLILLIGISSGKLQCVSVKETRTYVIGKKS